MVTSWTGLIKVSFLEKKNSEEKEIREFIVAIASVALTSPPPPPPPPTPHHYAGWLHDGRGLAAGKGVYFSFPVFYLGSIHMPVSVIHDKTHLNYFTSSYTSTSPYFLRHLGPRHLSSQS